MKPTKQVPLTVTALEQEATPMVLDKSPPVLSMGSRCVDGGNGKQAWFLWPGTKTPIWVIDEPTKMHELYDIVYKWIETHDPQTIGM